LRWLQRGPVSPAAPFELTEAGEFLLERGPALLSAADELWRNVRTCGTGKRGQVVIAYGASASYDTAPRLLHALAESHPGISIATAVKSVDEIAAELRPRLHPGSAGRRHHDHRTVVHVTRSAR
jgi:DNA-binding transcriptional LysR family regulator